MANLIPIATVIVTGSTSASISFTNIPQSYTDLKISISARTNRTGAAVDTIKLIFNGNTSGYSNKGLGGQSDSGAFSFTNVGSASIEDNAGTTTDDANANTFGTGDIYIANYTGSKYKLVASDGANENNAVRAYQFITSGMWSNTSPITSIVLTPLVGTSFTQYSAATLYGIRKY